MYSASVIIPVYNAEKTLRRCVEALYYAEERNIEIILIDDCSADNSWNLCQTLAGEYQNVRCYQNENNCGVSFTRNHGLEVATAPYILFVDSDDWTSFTYASKLLAFAAAHKDALPICGYTYINHVSDSRMIIQYGAGSIDAVDIADSFSLIDHVLLQQLWNKIFRRDIIEKYRIRFDEAQNMGEDFQFVLDYLEAAQIKMCVALNEPLYYYIRWNESSLMSKFGFANIQQEISRLEQLARIAGPGMEARRDTMIAQSKRNYIYHIARNQAYAKMDKLAAIEHIMNDGKELSYYREQRLQFAKEQIVQQLTQMKKLFLRIKGRVHRYRLQKRIKKYVSDINAEGISFISQNCIGGVLYHDLGLQFLSPTINAFIPEPGFVKLVLNLRHYMEQELIIRWGEEYPIGMLGDVEIHFMHYETCTAAKEAWEKRKKRINWNKVFVIGTDRDGFDADVYEQWKKVPYPKILFTAHSEFTEDAVFYPEHAETGHVEDLISNRKFYNNGILIEKIRNI